MTFPLCPVPPKYFLYKNNESSLPRMILSMDTVKVSLLKLKSLCALGDENENIAMEIIEVIFS